MESIDSKSNIIIKDAKLETELCDWFGVLKSISFKGHPEVRYLDREEAIKYFEEYLKGENPEGLLSKHFEDIDGIIKRNVRRLLDTYGIDGLVEAELTDYNEIDSSFNCVSGDRKVRVKLDYPNDYTRRSFASLEENNNGMKYQLERNDEVTTYGLVTYKRSNDQRSIKRTINDRDYYLSIREGNETTFIDIRYPEKLNKAIENTYFNNQQLENVILNSDKPLSIVEVYNIVIRIIKGMGKSFSNYKRIIIQKTKQKGKGNEEVITDRIDINHGELDTFVYTYKNRVITINKNGDWIVEDSTHRVQSTGKVNINYYAQDPVQVSKLRSPKQVYDRAVRDVDSIHALTLGMIERGKKNN